MALNSLGRTAAALAAFLTTMLAAGQDQDTLPAFVQLPRGTGSSPVNALVDCYFGAPCQVAEHCAPAPNLRPDGPELSIDDYDNQWEVDEGMVRWTPKRMNSREVCWVAARRGIVYVTAYRYFRHRVEGKSWAAPYTATVMGGAMLEAGASRGAPEPEPAEYAPANAYWFYQLVKGKKLCFDGCGMNTDSIYFRANDQTYAEIERLEAHGVRFTLFATQGTFEGYWTYEQTDAMSATVELQFDYDQLPDTCWLTLTFQTETSGASSNRCRVSEGDTGTWEIRDRP